MRRSMFLLPANVHMRYAGRGAVGRIASVRGGQWFVQMRLIHPSVKVGVVRGVWLGRALQFSLGCGLGC